MSNEVTTREVARHQNGTRVEIEVSGAPTWRRNDGEVIKPDSLWITLNRPGVSTWFVEGPMTESANGFVGVRQSIHSRDVTAREVPDWVLVELARVAH